MTMGAYDTDQPFVGMRSGVTLCGECFVEGCVPAEPGPFTCEACGRSFPESPLPERVPTWKRIADHFRRPALNQHGRDS